MMKKVFISKLLCKIAKGWYDLKHHSGGVRIIIVWLRPTKIYMIEIKTAHLTLLRYVLAKRVRSLTISLSRAAINGSL